MRAVQWKYKIGDRLIDYKDDGTLKRDLTIIDKKIVVEKQNRKNYKHGYVMRQFKYYQYKCNVCGWDDGWAREDNLFFHHNGCSCCGNMTVVKGINDVATTHPHLVQYFKNKNDAFLYSAYSNKCPELMCPNCGHVKTGLSMDTLLRSGFGCNMCSDGISYPEKFVNAFLKQLNVEYKMQLSCTTHPWCDRYKYDFWFKLDEAEYIVEVHGEQHYRKRGGWHDVKKNDAIKKELAYANGFNNGHYIIIDCRHSELEWIKSKICESALTQLFDLSAINWSLCHEIALKNLIKEVCVYWESNTKDSPIATSEVAQRFNISASTVLKYLKHGDELGWCNYNASKCARAMARKRNPTNGRKVVVLNHEREVICVFNSFANAERVAFELLGIAIDAASLQYTCAKKKSHLYKGYYFWYLEDYIKEFGEDSLQDVA